MSPQKASEAADKANDSDFSEGRTPKKPRDSPFEIYLLKTEEKKR